MYKLQIQTKITLKEVENPIEPRIRKSKNFNSLEIKDKTGQWILIVRFFNLSHLEQKEIGENVLNAINDAIKKRKKHIFVDV